MIRLLSKFLRPRFILLLLVQILVAATVVPYGYSGDSAFLMTSSCIMSKGQHLYADFFIHHGPLMLSVVSWAYRGLNICSLYVPRYIFFIFFCAICWLIVKYARSVKTALILLVMYALLSVSYSTTVILSETWLLNITLITFLLMFFHRRLPKWLFWVLFALVELSYALENPLYNVSGIVTLLYFLFEGKRNRAVLVLASVLPSVVFLTVFVHIREYWQSVYMFNVLYYSKFLGWSPEIYFNYGINLITTTAQFFSSFAFWKDTNRFRALFELFLIAVWVVIQIRIALRHKPAVTYYVHLAFVLSLLGRPDSYHIVPFLFFMLAEIIFFLPKTKTSAAVLVIIILFGMRLFYSPARYNFNSLYAAQVDYYNKLILANTKPGDHIILFTGQPDSYIATDRMPGRYYFQFLIWADLSPQAQQQLFRGITEKDIKLIIIEPSVLTFNTPYSASNIQKTLGFLNSNPSYRPVQLENNAFMYVRLP